MGLFQSTVSPKVTGKPGSAQPTLNLAVMVSPGTETPVMAMWLWEPSLAVVGGSEKASNRSLFPAKKASRGLAKVG